MIKSSSLLKFKSTTFRLVIIAVCLFTGLTSFYDGSEKALVQDVVNRTNEFRKLNGLPALVMQPALNHIARKHSEDMAKSKVPFGHDGFGQRNSLAQKAIPGIRSFAENVAYGARSGSEVVSMWKNSAGHRRNMVGNYKYIGIGIAKDSKGRIYYTQIFGGQ
jgi:uncharacterized protein YkwD